MTTAVETIRDIPFTIDGRSFHSRLMVGTGKYRDNDTMARAIDASGAEIVTVAVRRVDLDRTKEEGVLYHLDAKRDRKSTRLNSSHGYISYAVFCLKKKTPDLLRLPLSHSSAITAHFTACRSCA